MILKIIFGLNFIEVNFAIMGLNFTTAIIITTTDYLQNLLYSKHLV